MSNAAAMQAMSMQLGGSVAPRLRAPSPVPAAWTAAPTCADAFGRPGAVSFLGLEKTQVHVIDPATANPVYDHRPPEESPT